MGRLWRVLLYSMCKGLYSVTAACAPVSVVIHGKSDYVRLEWYLCIESTPLWLHLYVHENLHDVIVCVSTGMVSTYACVCCLAKARACVWRRSVFVSCHMCEAAVISQSGVWVSEEETRWGSRLMKDLHLPHTHTLKQTRTLSLTHTHTCATTHMVKNTPRFSFCFNRSHGCMATLSW